jgi:hypothetical protein
MLDGTMTADTNAPETPASSGASAADGHPANNETGLHVNLDAPEAGTEPEAPPVEDDDLDDWEDEGKTYKVPKKLKAGFMMNSDYTKKTQEVAETRRALEARQAELAQQAERVGQLTEDHKKLALAEYQLGRYEKVNWQQLYDQDPLEAPKRWMEYQQWKDYHGNLSSKVKQAEESRALEAQQAFAKRLEDCREYARREIKGWSQELNAALEKYAVDDLGFTQDTLKDALSPAFVKALHRAYIGDQVRQKQATAQPKPQIPEAKPTQTVTSRSSSPGARKSLADMDMEEYVAARKAGRKS